MMSENVTLLIVHSTPMTAQTSFASSRSQPTRSPLLGSTNSFGAYEASEAICSGASALIAAGTSAAMVAWTFGPAAPDDVAGLLEPPHAARTAIGTSRTMLARRERETVRRM